MPDPVTTTIGVGSLYGARQQKKAADKSISAQERTSDAAITESARQYDQTREDTRVARETGDQAMIALGFLLGTRQPPSTESIQTMKSELSNLESQLSMVSTDNQSGYLSEADGRAASLTASRAAGTVHSPNEIQSQIDALKQQIESAEQERNMALEMGGGMGKVPDLNTLFEGVNLPTGANIGSPDKYLPTSDISSPDSYLPDLDNFLQGLGEDLENSRGYQFELKQGREALQNILTQKGTAYGGNAIKEALMFSQDYASTKYGERHGQAMQEYDRAYQSGMTRYGMDVDQYNRDFQSGMTRYGMDIDKYNRDRQGAMDQYGLNMDRYRAEKEQGDTQFARLATMAGYGPAGTQISANAGQNYAQTVAGANQNMASTVGNAAYSVAGANTQALSNIMNTGMTMYQYNRMMDAYNKRTDAMV